MTALRLVERSIGPRTWYSLVRLDDDRIAMGGLRSPGEAEAWAMEAGHTVVSPPGVKVRVSLPTADDVAAWSPKQTRAVFAGIGTVVAADPKTLHAPSRPPHGASAPGRKSSSAGRAREAVSVPSMRVGPAVPTKETAQCCLAKRLPDGRPVIGWCGPECERRPA